MASLFNLLFNFITICRLIVRVSSEREHSSVSTIEAKRKSMTESLKVLFLLLSYVAVAKCQNYAGKIIK